MLSWIKRKIGQKVRTYAMRKFTGKDRAESNALGGTSLTLLDNTIDDFLFIVEKQANESAVTLKTACH